MSELKQLSTSSGNSGLRLRPAINPEIADLVGELALRYPPGRDDTPAEAKTRVRLLMEDLSDALDIDAARAGVREGVRVWRFLPTCAEVVEAAKDFVTARRSDKRRARDEETLAQTRALPAPAINAETRETILADCFAKLEAGYFRMEGRPMPGATKTVRTGGRNAPLREPTAAELAEIAAILDAKPRATRMTMTDADYAVIGMAVPDGPRDDGAGPSDAMLEIASRGRSGLPARYVA